MRALCIILMAALLLVAIAAPVSLGQQQTQDQSTPPIPAYRPPIVSLTDNGNSQDSSGDAELTPDTRPLAGVQDFSLGVPPLVRSYWQPRIDLLSTTDSDPLSGKGTSAWGTYASLLGGFDLHRVSGNSSLALAYQGGGTVTTDSTIGNSVIQEMQFSEKLSWRRSAISLIDQLGYIPESSFGYGGLSGVSLPGGGSLGLQNGFLPGQSVLTTRGQRLSNSFMTEVDAFATPRSSFTFIGGYSLLHYFDSSYLNFGDAIFQGGYNYQMSRRGALAAFYRFQGYRYGGYGQSINDHSFQGSFGYRVTGKLAFQVAGGPDVVFSQIPLSGSTGTGGGTTASSARQIYWTAHSALTYSLPRTKFGFVYDHGLSGGSGVLAGSEIDQVSGSAGGFLSRAWTGGLDLGYARNHGLSIATTTPSSRTYDYCFGGAYLSHTWGRSVSLFANYQIQYQTSSSTFSVGSTAGTSLVRHQVSIGFSWQARPLPF